MENSLIQSTSMVQHLMTDKFEMIRFERNLTIKDCVLSKEKTIYSLSQNKETEIDLIKSIFLLTQRFLLTNFPESAIDLTSDQFAQDIIDLRRDWNLNDIVMFFKFIRQRQDLPELKTYGGKITAIKLIEFSNYYENERCDVKEQYLSNIKNVKKSGDELVTKLNATFGKELLAKMNTEINKVRSDKIERAVKTNQFHKENEFCLNWLKENKVPENIGIVWFNLFNLRK